MKYCDRRIYEHLEIDYDGFKYYFMNKDVEEIYCEDDLEEIKNVFKKYNALVDSNSYYIIGNYFYFMYKDKKYVENISNFEDEENYIEDIINELSLLNCYNFYYNPGRLD